MKHTKTDKLKAITKLLLLIGAIVFTCMTVNHIVTSDKEKTMWASYTVVGLESANEQKIILTNNGTSYHISDEAAERVEIGDKCRFRYTTSHWFDQKYIIAAFCEEL